MSFNDFSKELSTKMGVKLQTLRRICFDYDKNPNIYIHLQVLCSNQKKAAQKGNIKVRDSPLTYNKDLDLELYDWVTCWIDLGLHITRENIQQKARELIQPQNPSFKASDSWLACFLSRHLLTLRKLNEKCSLQQTETDEICTKFVNSMNNFIKKEKIDKKFIVNMDETPFYWEYLPRKILTRKMTPKACAWKRGYHNTRSTVVLASTANGTLLNPSLILKRKTPYQLQQKNDIDLLMLNTDNRWMTEATMITWLEKIFLPYVGKNKCLLLIDSYEAHISKGVKDFIGKHKNINLDIIVGGTTNRAQPLDNGTNKSFKDVCRKCSIATTNATLNALVQTGSFEDLKQSKSGKLVLGKFSIFFN